MQNNKLLSDIVINNVSKFDKKDGSCKVVLRWGYIEEPTDRFVGEIECSPIWISDRSAWEKLHKYYLIPLQGNYVYKTVYENGRTIETRVLTDILKDGELIYSIPQK